MLPWLYYKIKQMPYVKHCSCGSLAIHMLDPLLDPLEPATTTQVRHQTGHCPGKVPRQYQALDTGRPVPAKHANQRQSGAPRQYLPRRLGQLPPSATAAARGRSICPLLIYLELLDMHVYVIITYTCMYAMISLSTNRRQPPNKSI